MVMQACTLEADRLSSSSTSAVITAHSTQQSPSTSTSTLFLDSGNLQSLSQHHVLTEANLKDHLKSLDYSKAQYLAHRPSSTTYSLVSAPRKRRRVSRYICNRPYRGTKSESGRCLTHSQPLKGGQHRGLFRSSSLDRGKRAYSTTWTTESFQLGPAVLVEKGLVETDPRDTALRWSEVNMPASGVGSGRGYSKSTQSSTAKSRTSDTSQSSKPKPPSPYDADFQERVLTPRSITVTEDASVTPHVHFESSKKNKVQDYKEKAPLVSVWLDPSPEFIRDIKREYTCMQTSLLCEAEFASYAKETLLKRDPRTLDVTSERGWKTERMVELVAKPQNGQQSNWRAPPLVGVQSSASTGSSTDYSFDLRPDCSYWLSLQAINPEYLGNIHKHVHIINRRITSPYLTVEFKRTEGVTAGLDVAVAQVAAASSVALYNRFLLKKKALRIAGKSWMPEKEKAFRHYGLTLKGSSYNVWVIEPRLTEEFNWAGCQMRNVWEGFLDIEASIRDFIDWVNEIHFWGLTVFGPECEADLKDCLDAKRSRFRISGLFADSESESRSQEGPELKDKPENV